MDEGIIQQASSRLDNLLGDLLEFTDDQPEESTMIDDQDSGIKLFGSSNFKITSFTSQPESHTVKYRSILPKTKFKSDDLNGVVVFPMKQNFPKYFKVSENTNSKWQLGKLIIPQEPLPHRSRYWPNQNRRTKDNTMHNTKKYSKPKFQTPKTIRKQTHDKPLKKSPKNSKKTTIDVSQIDNKSERKNVVTKKGKLKAIPKNLML